MRRSLLQLFLLFTLISSPLWADPLGEALIYHTYFSGPSEVRRLLEKGADPNTKDTHGWSALAIASDRSDENATAIASELIAKGADINAGNGSNYPIINAILNKNAALVALLVAHEANLSVRDAKGSSVFALARKMENPDIIYYLDKRVFEEKQLQTYLYSNVRLRQITERFAMENCQFQYWGFYLQSKQDKDMDEAALTKRIQGHATRAAELGRAGEPYFQALQEKGLTTLATNSRTPIYTELNDMISNRNRREQGIGTEADMKKRCDRVVKNILTSMGLNRF